MMNEVNDRHIIIGRAYLVQRVTPREILPDIWHWDYILRPNTIIDLAGWRSRTGDEVRRAMSPLRTLHYEYSYTTERRDNRGSNDRPTG